MTSASKQSQARTALEKVNSRIQSLHSSKTLVCPKGISRAPLPEEIPSKYAEDYKEACLVLSDSAKASAALSRRCLQRLIEEKESPKSSKLANQIQEVIDSGHLPPDLSDAIDAIRNIGNFADHPLKSERSGEIIDVEPGEAEWSLDVIEDLYDFYFVRQAKLRQQRDALDKKLVEAGRPPMKRGQGS